MAMNSTNHPSLATRQVVQHLRSLDIDEAEKALDGFVNAVTQAAFQGSAERTRYHYWTGFAQGVCVAVFVACVGILLR